MDRHYAVSYTHLDVYKRQVYIQATVNGSITIIMIDTGSNISLINQTELERIQLNCKLPIPTLPINNIIIIGATGKQNKTVRKQVSLDITSQNMTIPIVFLVASGLPFNVLIGCDVLRQHSAIINLQQGIVFLTSEKGIWSAKVVNCNHTPAVLNQDPVLKNYFCRNHETSIVKSDEDDNSELWGEKLEEIRIFQRLF